VSTPATYVIGPTLEEAVNSLLELHIDAPGDFVITPEVLSLIQVIYPTVNVALLNPSEKLFLGDSVDVYRLEVSSVGTENDEQRLYRVGEKRAMDAVARILKQPDTSYVTVIREDRS